MQSLLDPHCPPSTAATLAASIVDVLASHSVPDGEGVPDVLAGDEFACFLRAAAQCRLPDLQIQAVSMYNHAIHPSLIADIRQSGAAEPHRRRV